MKILKRKILLVLSLPIDFFQQNEGFSYKPYSFLYYLLKDYRRGSVRDAVGQLSQSGELDKISRNRVPYFRLTGVGRERLLSFFPISLGQKRVWDRRWRLAIVNEKRKPSSRAVRLSSPSKPQVEGTKNEKLNIRRMRRKLKQLSFKKLSRGVYLTPMPISEPLRDFLLGENLLGKVIVIESRRFVAGDDQNLAKNIWDLEKLVETYHLFIKNCKTLLKKMRSEKRLKNQDKNEVVDLFNDYFFLLSSDPGLPKKVLPSDWPGDFGRETFLRLFQRLKDEKMLDTF